MSAAAVLLFSLALDGLVVNKTTGAPAAGVSITLIQAGQGGMRPVGNTKSGADGRFSIDAQIAAGNIGMVQASYQGVTYSRMVQTDGPVTGIEVPVFDTSSDAKIAPVSQHMAVIEHVPGELRVSESVTLRNETNRTLIAPYRFYLPEAAADKVRINAMSGAAGMPVTRAANKTGEKDIYAVDYPAKPGETRIDISYVMPFATPAEFRGRVLHKDSPLNLIVPRGMSLKGDKLTSMGVEPRTQASIYRANFGAFTAMVEGAGTLRNTAPEEEDGGGGTPVDIIKPRIYDRVYWILGFAFTILAVAFYRLLGRSEA